MGLKEYRSKRDFGKTPEPGTPARSARFKAQAARSKGKTAAPAPAPAAGGRAFVVQKHAATNIHYDLRLQVGDVLKSWAVPKGPSLDPREKRLAVETEDHPLEYATFEGVIPKGEYGGGTMMVWDCGTWAPETDAAKSLKDGELKFRLEGERLKGRWMLVRTKYPGRQPQWLLMKERDSEAGAGVHAETFATSVTTGRSMDEIAAGAAAHPVPAREGPPRAAELRGARAAPMPAKLRPQLAVPAESAPEGDDWFHEVKFDGYRLLIFRKGDSIKILSRSGLDWTSKFPDLAAAVRDRLQVDAVLDGEAVVLNTTGVSDFQALQNAIHSRRSKAIVYFAFDLPWCDGHDLTTTPLDERRSLLGTLVGNRQESRLRFSEHVVGNGPAAYAHLCESGLEGVVSKRRSAPYVQSRTPSWLKVKCFNQQEFVIGGFSAPEGTRAQFGAMFLGYYDKDGALRFAGKVGTGFSAETLKKLGELLRKRVQAKPPFVNPPTGAEARGVTWVRPELVGQVQYRDWTDEGIIRHPSFRGLREDLDPATVVREPAAAPESAARPAALPARRTVKPRAAPASNSAPAAVGTVRLTNPDRIVYPDRGAGYTLTKLQVAEYYEAVAGRMVPHVGDRPLAILRCPDGEGKKYFFQKHPAKGMPAAVDGVDVPDDDDPGGTARHLMIRDAAGLLGLVQMNVLEFHPWGSRAESIEHPDRLIFDLDPGPGVSWRETVEAGVMLREALAQVKMKSFARVSGGKGVHVLVALKPEHTWAQAKSFCKAVADALVKIAPRRFIATSTLAARDNRIFIDYLRNVRGATAIAPYSTRARPGAPIALPVAWDELAGLPSAQSFSPASVIRRVAAGAPDPWKDMQASAGVLPDGIAW